MKIKFDLIKVKPVYHNSGDNPIMILKLLLPEKFLIDNSANYEIFFNTLINGGVMKLYINMNDVNYIDSWGIGTLIHATKRIRSNKGDLIISNLSNDVKKVFSLVKLESFLKIFNSELDAINYFRYF